MASDFFVSTGLVISQPTDALASLVSAIQRELEVHYSYYEILLVVQGPMRRQMSEAQMTEILTNTPCVRVIQLAFAVDVDVARSAIVENAIGDFLVIFDPNDDRPEMIAQAVSMCLRGDDIVIGVSTYAPPTSRRILRSLIEPLLTSIDYRLPANATSFRCISRRAINAVIGTGRFYHQFNLRLQKTGYRSAILSYEPKQGCWLGQSLLRAAREFFRLLIFNSTRPLRWMSGLGIFGSGVACLLAIYSLTIRIWKSEVIEGWTTTILFMSVQFMLLFVILAFVSEYMSRLLDEQRGSGDYAVVYERNSAMMINDRRVNVLSDSRSTETNRVQTARKG